MLRRAPLDIVVYLHLFAADVSLDGLFYPNDIFAETDLLFDLGALLDHDLRTPRNRSRPRRGRPPYRSSRPAGRRPHTPRSSPRAAGTCPRAALTKARTSLYLEALLAR